MDWLFGPFEINGVFVLIPSMINVQHVPLNNLISSLFFFLVNSVMNVVGSSSVYGFILAAHRRKYLCLS